MSKNLTLTIRSYQETDLADVIAIFKSNIPQYFAAEETQDLLDYLSHEREDYLVCIREGKLMAAGGINYTKEKGKAYLSWDFVDREQHGKGIGSALLAERLIRINRKPDISEIVVRTSQVACDFYQKKGFVIREIHRDYWAEGLDMVYMVYLEEK